MQKLGQHSQALELRHALESPHVREFVRLCTLWAKRRRAHEAKKTQEGGSR